MAIETNIAVYQSKVMPETEGSFLVLRGTLPATHLAALVNQLTAFGWAEVAPEDVWESIKEFVVASQTRYVPPPHPGFNVFAPPGSSQVGGNVVTGEFHGVIEGEGWGDDDAEQEAMTITLGPAPTEDSPPPPAPVQRARKSASKRGKTEQIPDASAETEENNGEQSV